MVSDKNIRTILTLPKEMKEILMSIAKEENRSFNNLIVTILIEYIKSRKQ